MKNQMTLEEARATYHNFKRVGNTVYYVLNQSQSYNNHTYTVMRVFGPPPTESDFIAGFGGNEWCGGVVYRSVGKTNKDYEFGEVFTFNIPGCD